MLAKYSRKVSYLWKEEYRKRHLIGKRVKEKVRSMSQEYFNKEEVSKEGFEIFEALMQGNEHGASFIIDELMTIVHDGNSSKNLTEKYYAEKVLRFIQQQRLKKEWGNFLSQPPSRQSLEKGAVLLAQWCQPTVDITINGVSDQLDVIATKVQKLLSERFKDHPACKGELLDVTEVQSSRWEPVQCKMVLEAVNYVLYQELEFHGNSDDYYLPDNSYINRVLETKTGIPISLAVVYCSVALRLGVVCEPVNFPSHFLLRWLQNPNLPEEQQYTYIDVFHEGRFMDENQCTNLLPYNTYTINRHVFDPAMPLMVFERMMRNLINIGRQVLGHGGDSLLMLRTALELFLILRPDDLEMTLLLSRVYLNIGINLSDVVDMLKRLATSVGPQQSSLITYLIMLAEERQNSEPQEKVKIKLRSEFPRVKHAVGMIMKHKKYHYTCVIYGWDNKCEATFEWMNQMGVHKLPLGPDQPFYNVLVEDGSNRYAAQENLLTTEEPCKITHPEVGKYFCDFRDTYYLPNKEKLDQYPEDLPVLDSYVRDTYGN
ncbi:F-box only protein 21 [Lingula anatina]|uniref:F-box only protein 21 n=1 Tax=Lingula anatina TaxID=7574 RepID=A0A1S3KGF1_LINAN|nr:F-box only protein 21 [Lingula anatina]|eukprot:XP_013421720.1 F-box only protein 21 [Lingula anatina]